MKKITSVVLSTFLFLGMLAVNIKSASAMGTDDEASEKIVEVYWGETEEMVLPETRSSDVTYISNTPLYGTYSNGNVVKMGNLYCTTTANKDTKEITDTGVELTSTNGFSLRNGLADIIQVEKATANQPANSKYYGYIYYTYLGESGLTPYFQCRHFYYQNGRWVIAKDTPW